jgi:hypothetical protein
MGLLDILANAMSNDDDDGIDIKIKADDYDDGVIYKTCPHCGERKPLSDFGLRRMTGTNTVRDQPWCKDCR